MTGHRLAWLAALAAGCIENAFVPDEPKATSGDTAGPLPFADTALPPEADDPAPPDIAVDPPAVAFSWVDVGDTAVQALEVANVGDGPLDLGAVAWDAPVAAFQLVAPVGLPVELAPGESLSLDVVYTATGLDGAEGLLHVESDDPDEPVVDVPVTADACEEDPPEGPFVVGPALDDTNRVSLLAWDGAGGFSSPDHEGDDGSGAWRGLVEADFDGDGLWEVVSRRERSHDLVFLSWSCGWHTTVLDENLPYTPEGGGDLDGDGDVDLYGYSDDHDEGWVGLDQGDGTFIHLGDAFDPDPTWSGYALKMAYHAGDIDEDGVPDLVAADYDSPGDDVSRIWLYRGVGDGTFEEPEQVGTIPTPVNGLDILDLDGDGHLDVLGGLDDDGDAGVMFVMWGTAGGLAEEAETWYDQAPGFEVGTNHPGGGYLRGYDWDGDGTPDVLTTYDLDPYGGSPRDLLLLWHAVASDGSHDASWALDPPGAMRYGNFAVPVEP